MTINNSSEYIKYYFEQYDQGNEEQSFQGLIDSPYDIYDELLEAFKKEQNEARQSFILEVLTHSHDKRNYDILKTALSSNKKKVWKSALDGLVGLSDSQALNIITEVCGEKTDNVFLEWAEEAIQQIQDKNNPSKNAEKIALTDKVVFDNSTKGVRVDVLTWACFSFCLSILLFFCDLPIMVSLSEIAVVLGIFCLMKTLSSKRCRKEKIVNVLIILIGITLGPGSFWVFIILLISHMKYN